MTWFIPNTISAAKSDTPQSPGNKTCTWTTGPLTCTVTGLTNGTAYTFTVKATNTKGASVASSPTAPLTPATVPGVPTAVTATAGNAQATVTWTAPVSNGGSPITSYTVTASPGGATCMWTTGPLTCTVTGLTNGTAYTFTVKATNVMGNGNNSAASAPVTPMTVPDAPTNPTATASNAQATVAWTAPASNGGSPITSYTVTSSPGNKTCTWTTGPLTCTVTGLTNGTAYTFTVKATNTKGASVASSPTAPVTPVSGSYFHPLSPTRLLDSRGPTGGWNATLAAGSPKTLMITGGTLGIPATADAVVMNVTVTNGTANSFVTVYPAGTAVPNASNVNFAAGQTIPNLVTVKIGAGGAVSFANAVGATDVIADVVGYYDAAPLDRFNPVNPARILDSRGSNGGWNAKLAAGAPKALTVRGAGGVSATADAVVMNVTVTNGTANSFVTVYPAGTAVPNASNVNFAAGQTIPNLVTVKIGTGGAVSFANAVGATDVIADVVGYYDASTGNVFHPVNPTRMLDSRGATGGWNTKLVAGAPRGLAVTGGPAAIPVGAAAIIGNTTVTNGTNNSYVTVYPAGTAVPNASSVNFAAGQTIPNLVTVKIGTGNTVNFANAIGAVDVIFDVVGYFDNT